MIVEGVPGSSARDQSRARADFMQEMKQYGCTDTYRRLQRVDVRRRHQARASVRQDF